MAAHLRHGGERKGTQARRRAHAQHVCWLPCRAVGVAILLCFSGVALITQPRFLGFPDTGRVTALGTFFALFQVSCRD